MPPSPGYQASKALLGDDGGYNPLVRSYLPGGGWQWGVVLFNSHDFNILDDVFQTNKQKSHRKNKNTHHIFVYETAPKVMFSTFLSNFSTSICDSIPPPKNTWNKCPLQSFETNKNDPKKHQETSLKLQLKPSFGQNHRDDDPLGPALVLFPWQVVFHQAGPRPVECPDPRQFPCETMGCKHSGYFPVETYPQVGSDPSFQEWKSYQNIIETTFWSYILHVWNEISPSKLAISHIY